KRLYPDSFAGRLRRSIQPVPVQIEGGPVVVLLNDMAQVSPGQATMALEMFEIIMALEAAGSIAELTRQAVAAGVGLDFGDVVRQLLGELDGALMLENGPVFSAFRTQYRQIPRRQAANAGRCYPEDGGACAKMVADWFAGKYPQFAGEEELAAREEEAAEAKKPSKLAQQLENPQAQPGLKTTKGGIIVPGGFDDEVLAAVPEPEAVGGAPKPLVTEPTTKASASGRVVAMIAPHIDLRRGGPCVAAAYKQLKRADGSYPKLAIVLGTCHHPTTRLAAVTGKTFATPLGDVEVHAEALTAFTKALSYDPQDEEYLFIADFPCEFQSLFVAERNANDQAKMQILPVIVGSLENAGCGMNLAEAAPGTVAAVKEVVAGIRAAIDAVQGDAVVIASADLSHIGERFEQPPVTEAILKEVQAADLEKLKVLAAVNAEGFAEAVLKSGNPTNICSTAVIYLATAAVAGKAKAGRLIRHEISPEEETKSAVSFASLLIEG
ncbi:MAG TPA: AmmeMemoRadiSam system protein B, partial [Planctomycetota bacterium]|nr:AmmeMemoRadiSam system protein B [Planctomycetota bacterium]